MPLRLRRKNAWNTRYFAETDRDATIKSQQTQKTVREEDVIDSHARMMEIEYLNSGLPSDHVDIKTTLGYFDELGLFLC